jgi:hypothetical protein
MLELKITANPLSDKTCTASIVLRVKAEEDALFAHVISEMMYNDQHCRELFLNAVGNYLSAHPDGMELFHRVMKADENKLVNKRHGKQKNNSDG